MSASQTLALIAIAICTTLWPPTARLVVAALFMALSALALNLGK